MPKNTLSSIDYLREMGLYNRLKGMKKHITYQNHINRKEMSQVSLEDVYVELKNVSARLESMEKTLETLVIMMLPEEEISEDEWREIEEAEAEIERGECVPLEEVMKEYGVE